MSFTLTRSPGRARTLTRLAVGTTTLLLGAATLTAASPSSAAPPPSEIVTQAQADTNNSSGCTATGGLADDSTDTPYVLGHTATQQLSNAATLTDNTDNTDTTTIQSYTKTTVSSTVAAGTISTMHVTGTATTTVNAAKGTATNCEPLASAVGAGVVSFPLSQPRWLTSTISTSSTATNGTVLLINTTTNAFTVLDSQTTKGTTVTHALVPAGSYAIEAIGGVGASILSSTPPFTGNGTKSGNYAIALTFNAPGAASSAARGSSGVATLPAATACPSHAALITWQKAAKKAGKAVVTVTGKAPKTVKHPKTGKHYVVHGLPAAGPFTITVKAGKKSVSRSYEACS